MSKTPITDAFIERKLAYKRKLAYSSLGEVLSWYEDAVTLARRLESERAELIEALQDISDELKQSNGGKGPSLPLSLHILKIASDALARLEGK